MRVIYKMMLMVIMSVLITTFMAGCMGADTIYSVTVVPQANAQIYTNVTEAKKGAVINIMVTPNAGYRLKEGSLIVTNANTGSKVSMNEVTKSFSMPKADVIITATIERILVERTISLSHFTNGNINLSKTTAYGNETITLTVSPNTGYELVPGSLKYNTTTLFLSNNQASFTMPNENVIISAEFRALNYYITSSSMSYGSVSAYKNMANYGDMIVMTISPNSGYRLKEGSLRFNEAPITNIIGNTATFTMPNENVVISAEFEKIPFTISFSTINNGTITSNKIEAYWGNVITLTITPNTNYILKSNSLKLNNTTITNITGNTATFTMPNENVVISAEFEALPKLSINISVVGSGSVVSNKTSAYAGELVTLTITPSAYTRLKNNTLKYNTTLITNITGNTAAFTMPNANVIITAEFEDVILGTWNIVTYNNFVEGDIITSTYGNSYRLTSNLFTLYFAPNYFVLNSAFGDIASAEGSWVRNAGQYTITISSGTTHTITLTEGNTLLTMTYSNHSSVATYKRQLDNVNSQKVGEWVTKSFEYDGVKYELGQTVSELLDQTLTEQTFVLTLYANNTFTLVSTVPLNSASGQVIFRSGYYSLNEDDYDTHNITFNNDGSVLAAYYNNSTAVIYFIKN